MDAEKTIQTTTEKPLILTVMQVLWPGFFAAGVLVTGLFSLVDPQSIEFVQEHVRNSREAAYTLAFLLIWLVVSAACATTLLLSAR